MNAPAAAGNRHRTKRSVTSVHSPGRATSMGRQLPRVPRISLRRRAAFADQWVRGVSNEWLLPDAARGLR